MRTINSLVAVALAIVAACMPAEAQTLYKCVVDGRTSYQSQPCAPRAAQSEIRAPAAPPRKEQEPDAAKPEEARPGARVTREELELVVETFVGYTLCAEADPGFGARLATGFEGWRERNAALLGRFNQDPEGPRLLQQRLQEERQRQQGDPAAARSARIETCVRTASRVKPLAPKR